VASIEKSIFWQSYSLQGVDLLKFYILGFISSRGCFRLQAGTDAAIDGQSFTRHIAIGWV
jgi:hypothetical protein